MQLFYYLSDPALEDALYEIEPMRRLGRLKLPDTSPDETTVLNFRHFLERAKLGILQEVNCYLKQQDFAVEGFDCRYQHHRRTQLNEEPGGQARSLDASHPRGQAVALWDENAHWRSRHAWSDP